MGQKIGIAISFLEEKFAAHNPNVECPIVDL
jgi:hypothetical protein